MSARFDAFEAPVGAVSGRSRTVPSDEVEDIRSCVGCGARFGGLRALVFDGCLGCYYGGRRVL